MAASGSGRRGGGAALAAATPPVAVAAAIAASTRQASTSSPVVPGSLFDDPDRLYKLLFAGGVAGAISRTLTAPVDRLKMLLQVHDHAHAMTIRDGLRTMAAEGTVRSWFRGNGANVLKIAPETALKLACNDRIKRLVAADPGAITPGERFIAGAAAGAVAQGAVYPLELVRTRLAVSPPGAYRGIADAAAQVWRVEGPRAFYRGIGPSLVGILPYAGVDIAVFELLKDRLVEAYPGGRPPAAAILAAGMASSSIAQFVSYPLALCRTRLQAQGRGGVPLKYGSALDVMRQALAREGPRGLYKGLLPNMMKVAPAAGISWFIYDEVKRAMGME